MCIKLILLLHVNKLIFYLKTFTMATKIKLANTINLIRNIEYHLKNNGLKI